MHHGNGLHAALRLLQFLLDLIRLGLTSLKPQQCGDGLQVVLDTMVNLGNRSVLGLQLLLTTAQLGDVTA